MDILTQPKMLGKHELKNPVTGASINLRNFARCDGRINDRHRKMYEEYGNSGMAMIVSDAMNVHEECQSYRTTIGIWDDSQIPDLSELAGLIKKDGALAIAQIAHRGANCFGGKKLSDAPLLRLLALQQDFIDAAVRAQKAGFDGVEVHCVHVFLLSQILSPITNDITWKYSGSLEKRAQYVVEIIKGIREKCGDDFLIGCRMACNEPDLATSIKIAQILEKAGVEYISVSSGVDTTLQQGGMDDNFDLGVEVPADFPYTKRVYGAWKIKENVNIPVIAANGIHTAEIARDVLEKGYADFVAVARPRLADPNWYNKIAKGEEPNKCFKCKVCFWLFDETRCPARKKLAQEEQ